MSASESEDLDFDDEPEEQVCKWKEISALARNQNVYTTIKIKWRWREISVVYRD